MRHRLPQALLLAHLSMSTAWASPASGVQVEVVESTEEAGLAAALREYQLGHRDAARGMLAELLLDPGAVDTEVGREALIYMGELHYIEGDEESARKFFERVATSNPNHLIDPFRHPPDVCGFYNYVRAYVVPAVESRSIPEAPPPVPWTAWVPVGGVYQLTHGEAARGTAFLVGELALLTGSSTLFAIYASRRHISSDDPQARSQAQTLRTAQWLVTAGYWGVWTWSRVDAHRHWQKTWRVAPEVALGPSRHLGMVLDHRF